MEGGTREREPGLPREVEGLSQRDRLLWSMVRVVAEKGYDGVVLGDVVARAGVSRTTFYDEFANKDECLFAAYDRVIDVLVHYVEEAYGREGEWPERIREGLRALLEALAAEPEVAQMAVVAFPAAGPAAHQRYRDALERFLPFFAEGRRYSPRTEDLPPGVDLMAVGGAEVIIFDEVVAERVSKLPGMLPEILFAVLVPYIGPDAAATEMHKVASPAGR
jgi:AcrR family transcriptional regulator